MRLHRFIGDFDTNKASLKIKDGELLNQIRNVLRLKIGEEVVLGDGNRNEVKAKIIEIGRDFVEFEVSDRFLNKNEPEADIILYCSILKRENFELVIQKVTEIGAKEIVPIISERTVKLDIRKDRLEKIIKEAAEQSGRGIVPVLHNPINFEDALKNIKKDISNLFFDVSGKSLNEALATDPLLLTTSVWIGPEGGWSLQELEIAKNSGFHIISLGKTTLRAETAAIVATHLVVHSLNYR